MYTIIHKKNKNSPSHADSDRVKSRRWNEIRRVALLLGNKRSADVVAAFRRIHPCPTTGLSSGSCPEWSINHVIPLVVDGCDSVSNLQWLPNEIKSCVGDGF